MSLEKAKKAVEETLAARKERGNAVLAILRNVPPFPEFKQFSAALKDLCQAAYDCGIAEAVLQFAKDQEEKVKQLQAAKPETPVFDGSKSLNSDDTEVRANQVREVERMLAEWAAEDAEAEREKSRIVVEEAPAEIDLDSILN